MRERGPLCLCVCCGLGADGGSRPDGGERFRGWVSGYVPGRGGTRITDISRSGKMVGLDAYERSLLALKESINSTLATPGEGAQGKSSIVLPA